MTRNSLLALGTLVLALAGACDAGSPARSPSPYPTLIPLTTAGSSASPSAPASSSSPAATPTPDRSQPPALLPLPGEFSTIPKGHGTYEYAPTSKQGSFPLGTPRNLHFGACGIFMPIDINGVVWDATYGDDGQGGALTQDQLDDLRTAGKVTVTLIDDNTLQLVTKHGATIRFTPHDGSRRYKTCN